MSSSISLHPILQLYLQYGTANYIGEDISQLEHALQAAYIAISLRPSDPEFILAALFHDIGHIIPHSIDSRDPVDSYSTMNIYGIAEHEIIGAEYILQLGFPTRIASIIRNHVNAKRYLAFKNITYITSLSNASKITLEYQGGIMNSNEAAAFEMDPLFPDYILLRQIDEHAKDKHAPHYPILHYQSLIDIIINKSAT